MDDGVDLKTSEEWQRLARAALEIRSRAVAPVATGLAPEPLRRRLSQYLSIAIRPSRGNLYLAKQTRPAEQTLDRREYGSGWCPAAASRSLMLRLRETELFCDVTRPMMA